MMTVSLHAMKEKTYNKIVRGGNYKKVIENLEYLSSLKKQGKIERLELHFTVTSLNYKEIPDIIKYTRKLGAKIRLLGLDCSRDLEKLYNQLNIQSTNHPDYNKLVMLTHKKEFLLSNDVVIQGHEYFSGLKPISFIQTIKNKFNKN